MGVDDSSMVAVVTGSWRYEKGETAIIEHKE